MSWSGKSTLIKLLAWYLRPITWSISVDGQDLTQRLAIAKIFLKDPEIIFLDEPTSSLDSFSEDAITEAMHTLFEGRTVIVIAHRLQTVKEADKIYVLDAWKVVEEWIHPSLVNQDWVYASMLALQSWF